MESLYNFAPPTHIASLLSVLGVVARELDIPLTESDIHLEHPADPSHGDFATSLAMQAFGKLDAEEKAQFKNPRAFAQHICDTLNANEEFLKMAETAEVAGPGFMNIRLKTSSLTQLANVALQKETLQNELKDAQFSLKKVCLEFTDPNPFKELHIGHAYSNSVGESLSRIMEAKGAEVEQYCYQGDVGMHVAKSIWGMRKLFEKEGKSLESLETQPLSERIHFLGQSYAHGATAYEESEDAKKEMQTLNALVYASAQRQLQKEKNWQPQINYLKNVPEDPRLLAEVSRIYEAGRAWSMQYFDEMYGRLGMREKQPGQHFDRYYRESVVGEFGYHIVQEFLAKGIFEQSNGAIVFPGEKYGLHTRVFVNALGLPTYEAKELGLAPEKYKDFPYDLSFVITANEIDEYFKVLLKTMSLTHPEIAAKTHHMSHGMVRLPEGKMSSRTGKVVTAQQVLDEVEARVEKLLQESRPEMSEEKRHQITHVVALAALKYAFLKQSIGGDITFDIDTSISMTGQSGPYIMYMYVRALSILRKSGKTNAEISQISPNRDFEAAELALLKTLALFPEKVTLAAEQAAPHHIAQYLYELAQTFSVFYTECSILQAPPEILESRLALTQATAHTLQTGFWLLGIPTTDEM